MGEDRQIDGVKVRPLRVIPDERGEITEILRCDDEDFREFGQVYVSMCYPGVVKGWHYHKLQFDYFAVVKGMAKVALYDAREDSPTCGEVNEFFMGDRAPVLLIIPPGVLHGIKAIGGEPAYLVNCPTLPYNRSSPDEYRVHPYNNDIPYDWGVREG